MRYFQHCMYLPRASGEISPDARYTQMKLKWPRYYCKGEIPIKEVPRRHTLESLRWRIDSNLQGTFRLHQLQSKNDFSSAALLVLRAHFAQTRDDNLTFSLSEYPKSCRNPATAAVSKHLTFLEWKKYFP